MKKATLTQAATMIINEAKHISPEDFKTYCAFIADDISAGRLSPSQLFLIETYMRSYAITDKMNAKMEGMQALSTSVKENILCRKKAACDALICSHCYANDQLTTQPNTAAKLARNTAILTHVLIPLEAMPLINAAFFRFEAHGDLNNETQVLNYFNLCVKNPHTHFALWTKNPWLIRNAIAAGAVKPSNLIIIYSSPLTNYFATEIMNRYAFIDKVFTVYDAETIAKQHININCGGRHCLSCLRCYFKDTDTIISEKLK